MALRLVAMLAVLAFSSVALAEDSSIAAGLARCVDISAREARLACYDKLAGRPPETTKQAPMADPRAAKANPPAIADDDPRNFGLNQAQLHATPQGPASIEARVVRLGAGQPGARGYVVLDNGQTWTYTDADEDKRLRAGDLVTIRRGALTSFVMTSASKRSYHVHRTR